MPLLWLPLIIFIISYWFVNGVISLEACAILVAISFLNYCVSNFLKSARQIYFFDFILSVSAIFMLLSGIKSVAAWHSAAVIDGAENYYLEAVNLPSNGVLGLMLCAVLPFVLTAIIARRLSVERRILSVFLFAVIWYGISRCLGWSVLICASLTVIAVPFMFAVTKREFYSYFSMILLLVVGTWTGVILNFYYLCKILKTSFVMAINLDIALWSQRMSEALSGSTLFGRLPDAGAPSISFSGFLLDYGWCGFLFAGIPTIYIFVKLILRFKELPLSIDGFNLPVLSRSDVRDSLIHRELKTRVSILKTPDERILVGISLLALGECIFLSIFADISYTYQLAAMWACILGVSQISAQSSRFRPKNRRVFRLFAGLICLLISALFGAQLCQRSVLYLAYQESQKINVDSSSK